MRAAMLAVALTMAIPNVAFAGDAAQAEQLFSEGLAAMKAERWQAACDAFAGSNEADPSPGTQINLGVCNEKQKRYATALTWFDAAARLAEEQGREDRAKLARSEHARVAPKVHKLVVKVATPVPGATISRNGDKIPASLLVDKETPLDPGTYTLELSAKGKKPITKEITIPETAGTSTIDFPAMEDAPIDSAAPGPGVGEPGYSAPIIVNDGSGQRTVGIVVGGVGILALLAAGGVQILAINEEEASKDAFTESRNPKLDSKAKAEWEASGRDRHENAKNNQLIAIITGGGGVVLLGVGALLFFTAPSGPKSTKSARSGFVPVAGPGYAGAAFGGTF